MQYCRHKTVQSKQKVSVGTATEEWMFGFYDLRTLVSHRLIPWYPTQRIGPFDEPPNTPGLSRFYCIERNLSTRPAVGSVRSLRLGAIPQGQYKQTIYPAVRQPSPAAVPRDGRQKLRWRTL